MLGHAQAHVIHRTTGRVLYAAVQAVDEATPRLVPFHRFVWNRDQRELFLHPMRSRSASTSVSLSLSLSSSISFFHSLFLSLSLSISLFLSTSPSFTPSSPFLPRANFLASRVTAW